MPFYFCFFLEKYMDCSCNFCRMAWIPYIQNGFEFKQTKHVLKSILRALVEARKFDFSYVGVNMVNVTHLLA